MTDNALNLTPEQIATWLQHTAHTATQVPPPSKGLASPTTIGQHTITTGITSGSYYACDNFFNSFKAKHGFDLEQLILSYVKQHHPECLI